MTYLDSVSMTGLHRALETVEGRTPTLRVVVAINYKRGVSPTALAEWYDLSRTTVYHWLERLERLADEPVADVVYDADRPGRPPKLTPTQRERLSRDLASSPRSAGFEADEWTPELLGRHVRDRYDTDYSLRHLRDLLGELRRRAPG